jgi:Amt family ammonium transporter
MSAILAYIVNYIPGLHLRASEEAELLGMDDDQLGEFAYDYVEVSFMAMRGDLLPFANNRVTRQVRRDYLAWTPNNPHQNGVDPDMPHEHRFGIGEHTDMIKKAGNSNGSAVGSPKPHKQELPTQGDRHGIAAEEQEKAKHDPGSGP